MCSIIQNTRCLLACAWAGLADLARTDTTACLVRTFWFGGTFFFFVAKCNLWIHYTTHIFSSHCWFPDNSPGIGSNFGLQKKNLVLIHFIINTCVVVVVVVAAAAQQHVWQQRCCFSKAQLEIFSTFQHKARVMTFFFLTDWTDSAAE